MKIYGLVKKFRKIKLEKQSVILRMEWKERESGVEKNITIYDQ